MDAYVVARRRERNGFCDLHGSYVGRARTVSRVLIVRDNGERLMLRGCKACWRAAAAIAGAVK